MAFELSDKKYSVNIFLSAGKCNAEGELPVQSLFQYLIDAATAHANSLNFGYSRLIAQNCTWVLSRIAIEMKSYPKINENFIITTWIVSTNRVYSDRAFMVKDASGNVIGYAMTTWAAIDINARRAANIEKLFPEGLPDTGEFPPIKFSKRIASIDNPDSIHNYVFRYCDIDCNRHVNSTRYVELILNLFSVDYFDSRIISNIEISYHSEAYYGEQVEIRSTQHENDSDTICFEIRRGETPLTRVKITVKDRPSLFSHYFAE